MSNFLENYGKAIFVLVLIAILIAFASPLGIKIKEYTLAKVDNLKQTSDDLIAGKPKVDPNEPKEVTDIYAILYADGELDLSSKEIVSEEGREVTEQWNKVTNYTSAWANYATGYRKKIITVKVLDSIKPITCRDMFVGCSNLTTLVNFDKFYTSETTNFYNMFCNCTSLIDISSLQNWNVSNGTNFSYMFQDCESLKDITPLKNWDVSNGTDFRYMFQDCESLKDISPLKNWSVSNGTDFNGMFENCESLYDATCLNNWNVNSSATKTSMFANTKVTAFPSWYK